MPVWRFPNLDIIGSGPNVQLAWEDACADLNEDPGQAPQTAVLLEGNAEEIQQQAIQEAIATVGIMTEDELRTLHKSHGCTYVEKMSVEHMKHGASLALTQGHFKPEIVHQINRSRLSPENLFKDAPVIEKGSILHDLQLLLGDIALQCGDNLKKIQESGVLTGEEPPRRVAVFSFILACEQHIPSGSLDNPEGEPAKFLAKLREVLS